MEPKKCVSEPVHIKNRPAGTGKRKARTPDDRELEREIDRRVARGIRRSRLKRRLFKSALILVVLIGGILVWQYQRTDFSSDVNLSTGLTHTGVDFGGILLGEAKQRGMYVVLEQPAVISTEIEQSVLGLDIFKKVRTVNAPGTGYFAVDLTRLTEEDITVNETVQTVTVTVPSASLYTIGYQWSDATFEDNTRGTLAIGQLKLTPEQNTKLEQGIDTALREKFSEDGMTEKANEAAKEQLKALFGSVIRAVAPDMTVIIRIRESSAEQAAPAAPAPTKVPASGSVTVTVPSVG